jgi:hypothetical protein
MSDVTFNRPPCNALDLTQDAEVNKTPGLRLYDCAPGWVALQIRSVGSTTQRRGGVAKHIVSTANLDLESAEMLVRRLNHFITSQKGKKS